MEYNFNHIYFIGIGGISIEGKGLIFEKLARELNNENTFD
jgi:uridine kinase